MPAKITGYTVYRQPSLWSHARALMRETFANSELVEKFDFRGQNICRTSFVTLSLQVVL